MLQVRCLACAFCSLVSMLSAQTGGHPHIAQEGAGFSLAALGLQSPLFNQPDGKWNFGEGFTMAGSTFDVGGVLSRDDPALLNPATDVLTVTPWGPFVGHPGIERFVGKLRCARFPTGEDEAGFEILMPSSIGNKRLVLMLVARPTTAVFAPSKALYHPFEYPGEPGSGESLIWDYNGSGQRTLVNRPSPMGMAEYMLGDPDIAVVEAHYVSRMSGMPLVFAMQRLRQVRLACIQAVLQHLSPSPPPDFPTLVAGSSFGGLVAPVALLLWPQEFQAGIGFAYSGQHRTVPEEQSWHQLQGSLLGLTRTDTGYSRQAACDWPIFAQLEGTDYIGMSVVNRIQHNQLQRPLFLLVGDEDPVTNGQDWIHVLAQSSSLTQHQGGTRTLTINAVGSGTRQIDVHWAVLAKICHAGDKGLDPYRLPDNSYTKDMLEAVEWMIRAADAQRTVAAFTIDQLNVRMTTKHTSITTFEPREHVLHRPAARQASIGNLLTRDQTFKQLGQGTWPGAAQSLKAYRLASEDRDSIYAGSSDGMLGRWKMEAHTPSGGTQHEALVVQATSNDGANGPYNLGALVYGLAVGDFSNLGYPVVVAGAYRRLGLFRADTLQLVRHGGAPLTMDLSWDLT